MNVVTKSGTNAFHGSGFVFHNNNELNSRSNLDKAAGRTEAPFRVENQYGGTLGGRLLRDRTFFFGSYPALDAIAAWLRASRSTARPPKRAGQVLQSAAGSRPQVAALLKHLPAADAPIGRTATFTADGQTYTVPLGLAHRLVAQSSQQQSVLRPGRPPAHARTTP